MRRSLPALLLLAAAPMTAASAAEPAAEPATKPVGVVVGWDPGDGHVLLNELNCTACHDPGEAAARLLPKQSPVLKEIGRRVTPQYLRKYLADPQAVKPGTPMPHLLHALGGEKHGEKSEIVEDLTHYLVSLGGPIDQRASGSSAAQIQLGEKLFHSVGCVACHQPQIAPPAHDRDLPKGIEPEDLAALNLPGTAPPKPSIPLGKLAMKTTVEALAEFLRNPLHTRPSGRMPSLKLDAGEARSIAAYLLREQFDESHRAVGSGLDWAYYEGRWGDVPQWDTLQPKAEGTARNFNLGEVRDPSGQPVPNNGGGPPDNFGVRFRGVIEIPTDGEYRFWTKSDDGSTLLIDGREVVDNGGVHAPGEKEGRVTLTKGQHPIEVGFFEVGGGHELTVHWQPPGGKRGPIPEGILLHDTAAMLPLGIAEGEQFRLDAERAKRGRERFDALGCATCHDDGRPRTPLDPALAFARLDPAEPTGCLGGNVANGRPKYAFTEAQRQATQKALAALQKKTGEPNIAERVDFAMSAMSCYRCHERDEKGGPDLLRANYFQYLKHVDLGDEGRLPPPLEHVGVKLTAAGFADMLLDGVKYRTYMAARMPAFGRENVAWLATAFPRADAGEVPPHQPNFSSSLVETGRELAGKKGFACINCHAWGDLRLPGAEGLDLLKITHRVTPEYFHAFLKDPQALKPRTRMPTGWPAGKSAYPEILDGDMHAQIDALWAYLSVGQKGGIPFGLSPDDATMLTPVDEPITFRTFLDGVSAHAVCVGFPQRTNVAFDANRVRSVVAWSGDFVSTRSAWDGRGGQYAAIPSADRLQLPDGPAFARLGSLEDSWPQDLPKAAFGSSRTPEGFEFRGYRFDEERVPTFLYTIPGGVEVEETFGTELRQGGTLLLRRFRLESEQDATDLYFLAATGKTIHAADGVFTIDEHTRVAITGTDVEPVIRTAGDQKQLLLPVPITGNGGGRAAEFTVEYMW